MQWTQSLLAHYLDQIQTTIEFKGITGDELWLALHEESMLRLQRVGDIVCDDHLSSDEKVTAIYSLLEK